MSKLGGSKIPAQKRLDIERSLRVKDAVDVLDTLEDAYYNKVKFIDGMNRGQVPFIRLNV